jgi:hypothetical protein
LQLILKIKKLSSMKKQGLILASALMMFVLTLTVACKSDSATDAETTAADTTATAVNADPNASMTLDPNAATPTDAAADAVPTGPTTSLSITNGLEHDYGTIDAGVKVKHTFKFKNTGSEPLVISNCKGSCGCTVPKCPTEPIAPGGEGEIPVEFDSKGKNGPDTKTVTITANTNPAQTLLTIKGNVKGTPPPAQ